MQGESDGIVTLENEERSYHCEGNAHSKLKLHLVDKQVVIISYKLIDFSYSCLS